MYYDATSLNNTTSNNNGNSGKMVQFMQLAREQIKNGTYLVISLRNDGKIAIAQQVEALSGDKPINIFLKGTLELEDYEVLRTIVNMYQEVIDWLENEGLMTKVAS